MAILNTLKKKEEEKKKMEEEKKVEEQQVEAEVSSQDLMDIMSDIQDRLDLSELYKDPLRVHRFQVNSYRIMQQNQIQNLQRLSNVELLLEDLKKKIDLLDIEESQEEK